MHVDISIDDISVKMFNRATFYFLYCHREIRTYMKIKMREYILAVSV